MSQATTIRARPPAQAAAQHPVAWACYVNPKYDPARHIRFLGGVLKQVDEGKLLRVAISIPPRHGKSTLISRHFSAWWLGRHPEMKVMLITMQERFSRRWARAARDDFAAYGPEIFGVTTHPRASTAEWEVFRAFTRTDGSMSAVGSGGTITGKGADLMLVDDLIRSDREAQNPNLREAQWDWFQSAVETRLEPPGRCVVLSTRWHHDDLIGRLMKGQASGELGEEWTFINLPAIAEEGDLMGRKPGEALWPERLSAEWLEKKRRNVGPSVWDRLYQGRPTPEAGDTFKRAWFRYYDKTPQGSIQIPKVTPIPVDSMYRFATVDLAASMRKRSDYTVMGIWGFCANPHSLILLDLVRDRLSGQEIVAMLDARVKAHGLSVVYVEREGKWLEEKLGSVIKVAMQSGIPVVELTPVKDKRERAMSVQDLFAAGYIHFPKASWLPLVEEELLTFPDGEHDDVVDVCVYGASVFRELMLSTLEPDDERRSSQVRKIRTVY